MFFASLSWCLLLLGDRVCMCSVKPVLTVVHPRVGNNSRRAPFPSCPLFCSVSSQRIRAKLDASRLKAQYGSYTTHLREQLAGMGVETVGLHEHAASRSSGTDAAKSARASTASIASARSTGSGVAGVGTSDALEFKIDEDVAGDAAVAPLPTPTYVSARAYSLGPCGLSSVTFHTHTLGMSCSSGSGGEFDPDAELRKLHAAHLDIAVRESALVSTAQYARLTADFEAANKRLQEVLFSCSLAVFCHSWLLSHHSVAVLLCVRVVVLVCFVGAAGSRAS